MRISELLAYDDGVKRATVEPTELSLVPISTYASSDTLTELGRVPYEPTKDTFLCPLSQLGHFMNIFAESGEAQCKVMGVYPVINESGTAEDAEVDVSMEMVVRFFSYECVQLQRQAVLPNLPFRELVVYGYPINRSTDVKEDKVVSVDNPFVVLTVQRDFIVEALQPRTYEYQWTMRANEGLLPGQSVLLGFENLYRVARLTELKLNVDAGGARMECTATHEADTAEPSVIAYDGTYIVISYDDPLQVVAAVSSPIEVPELADGVADNALLRVVLDNGILPPVPLDPPLVIPLAGTPTITKTYNLGEYVKVPGRAKVRLELYGSIGTPWFTPIEYRSDDPLACAIYAGEWGATAGWSYDRD